MPMKDSLSNFSDFLDSPWRDPQGFRPWRFVQLTRREFLFLLAYPRATPRIESSNHAFRVLHGCLQADHKIDMKEVDTTNKSHRGGSARASSFCGNKPPLEYVSRKTSVCFSPANFSPPFFYLHRPDRARARSGTPGYPLRLGNCFPYMLEGSQTLKG